MEDNHNTKTGKAGNPEKGPGKNRLGLDSPEIIAGIGLAALVINEAEAKDAEVKDLDQQTARQPMDARATDELLNVVATTVLSGLTGGASGDNSVASPDGLPVASVDAAQISQDSGGQNIVLAAAETDSSSNSQACSTNDASSANAAASSNGEGDKCAAVIPDSGSGAASQASSDGAAASDSAAAMASHEPTGLGFMTPAAFSSISLGTAATIGVVGVAAIVSPAAVSAIAAIASHKGTLIDGWVKGATVYYDANNDNIQDNGETSVITDQNGNWTLNYNTTTNGKLVSVGGIDILTGQSVGTMTAANGSTVITPLTTILQASAEQAATTGGTALTEAALKQALGIPASVNLATYDPVAQMVNPDPTTTSAVALNVFTVSQQLMTVINASSALAAQSAGTLTPTSTGSVVAPVSSVSTIAANIADTLSAVATNVSLTTAASTGNTSVAMAAVTAVAFTVAAGATASGSAAATTTDVANLIQQASTGTNVITGVNTITNVTVASQVSANISNEVAATQNINQVIATSYTGTSGNTLAKQLQAVAANPTSTVAQSELAATVSNTAVAQDLLVKAIVQSNTVIVDTTTASTQTQGANTLNALSSQSSLTTISTQYQTAIAAHNNTPTSSAATVNTGTTSNGVSVTLTINTVDVAHIPTDGSPYYLSDTAANIASAVAGNASLAKALSVTVIDLPTTLTSAQVTQIASLTVPHEYSVLTSGMVTPAQAVTMSNVGLKFPNGGGAIDETGASALGLTATQLQSIGVTNLFNTSAALVLSEVNASGLLNAGISLVGGCTVQAANPALGLTLTQLEALGVSNVTGATSVSDGAGANLSAGLPTFSSPVTLNLTPVQLSALQANPATALAALKAHNITVLSTGGTDIVSQSFVDSMASVGLSFASSDTVIPINTATLSAAITSPALTNNAHPVISGVAQAGTTVTLTVNGASFTTTASNGVWSIDLSKAVPSSGTLSLNANGTNAISVTATDAVNNVSPATAQSTQTLVIDTIAPAVAITSNTLTNNPAPVLTGTAREANANVTVKVGGASYLTKASGSGVWSIDLGGSMPLVSGSLVLDKNGNNSVSVTATDAAGNVSAPVQQILTIDTTAPVVAVSHVTGATGFDSGFSVAAGAIVTLTGASLSNFTVNTANGVDTYTAKAGVFTGAETITVNATLADAAGNVGTASQVTLASIDTTAPVAPSSPVLAAVSDSGLSHTDGITNVTTPLISGTAEAGANVTLFDTNGTTVLGTAVAGSNGAWSITSSALTEGAHALSAKATDLAGNTSTASLSGQLVVDTTAPVVAVSHVAGAIGFDSGFSVAAGATVTLTGASLSNFTMTTVNGLDTYTAKTGVFTGTETIKVNATLADAAGNVGTAPQVTLASIDTVAPVAPTLSLALDTGILGDNITSNASLNSQGIETGATVAYSTDGTHWNNTFTPVSGVNTVYQHQTDAAGNISAASPALTFTYDPTNALPSVASLQSMGFGPVTADTASLNLPLGAVDWNKPLPAFDHSLTVAVGVTDSQMAGVLTPSTPSHEQALHSAGVSVIDLTSNGVSLNETQVQDMINASLHFATNDTAVTVHAAGTVLHNSVLDLQQIGVSSVVLDAGGGLTIAAGAGADLGAHIPVVSGATGPVTLTLTDNQLNSVVNNSTVDLTALNTAGFTQISTGVETANGLSVGVETVSSSFVTDMTAHSLTFAPTDQVTLNVTPTDLLAMNNNSLSTTANELNTLHVGVIDLTNNAAIDLNEAQAQSLITAGLHFAATDTNIAVHAAGTHLASSVHDLQGLGVDTINGDGVAGHNLIAQLGSTNVSTALHDVIAQGLPQFNPTHTSTSHVELAVNDNQLANIDLGQIAALQNHGVDAIDLHNVTANTTQVVELASQTAPISDTTVGFTVTDELASVLLNAGLLTAPESKSVTVNVVDAAGHSALSLVMMGELGVNHVNTLGATEIVQLGIDPSTHHDADINTLIATLSNLQGVTHEHMFVDATNVELDLGANLSFSQLTQGLNQTQINELKLLGIDTVKDVGGTTHPLV